jgi:putative ABC transport system ATP-binding protein
VEAISVQHVTKSYSRDKLVVPVLSDITMSIQEGEFVALMGPSGSGKTTLLNLIAGIDRPSSGTIKVFNEDIGQKSETALAKWRSTHIGFIFQFYNLIPVLSAYENVELPLMLSSLSRDRRQKQVETALGIVSLSDRMKHKPNQLSGGQQQRVAIARAIATDPKIIVADEPTGDLDKVSAREVMVLLKRLNQEFHKTIVMVTHDPAAAEYASHIRHLEKGDLFPEDGK